MSGRAAGGSVHRGDRVEREVPDGQVGLGRGTPRSPGAAARGRTSPIAPAMTVTSPRAAVVVGGHEAGDVLAPQHREVRVDHLVAGRQVQPDLEQLGRVRARCGRAAGTSRSARCPRPAVSHWTSPRPKRAVAPSESEWSMNPRRTKVTVSKPRCGCWGKPGDDAAVVHAPPVGSREVHAEVAGLERRGRAHVLVGRRVAVEVVDAEQEGVRGAPLPAQGDGLEHRAVHHRA